jgi:hypothetical protein
MHTSICCSLLMMTGDNDKRHDHMDPPCILRGRHAPVAHPSRAFPPAKIDLPRDGVVAAKAEDQGFEPRLMIP